jgi:hypothetical protein
LPRKEISIPDGSPGLHTPDKRVRTSSIIQNASIPPAYIPIAENGKPLWLRENKKVSFSKLYIDHFFLSLLWEKVKCTKLRKVRLYFSQLSLGIVIARRLQRDVVYFLADQ